MNYTADQIVGKSLVARLPVKVLRIADDQAQSVYTAAPGESIGIVQSYLLPGSGRTSLYWVFQDSKGRYYYVSHAPGKFDVQSLQAQGALTLEQQQEELAEKNKTLQQRIFASLQNFALIGAGIYLLGQLIKSRK